LSTPVFNSGELARIQPSPFGRVLFRGVRFNTLLSKNPPQPLFASDSPNRYNLRGTRTLYFGENVLTAYSETVQQPSAVLLNHPTRERKTAGGYEIGEENEEPVVVFAVRAWLDRTLDLTDAAVLSRLGVVEHSLLQPWRWAASMGLVPLTQQLGDEVFKTSRFDAIRYPSEKALDPHRVDRHTAWAIFVDRLSATSFVQVSDVSRRLHGRLP
jgi:RES domain-containing protein